LDQELAIMMKNKKMNDDDQEYVGFIRNAIGHREEIRNIDVYYYISNILIGLDQAGKSQ
jgi:hypothetical protein